MHAGGGKCSFSLKIASNLNFSGRNGILILKNVLKDMSHGYVWTNRKKVIKDPLNGGHLGFF